MQNYKYLRVVIMIRAFWLTHGHTHTQIAFDRLHYCSVSRPKAIDIKILLKTKNTEQIYVATI